MTVVQTATARLQALLPEFRVRVSIPMPYQDEEGQWHEPEEGALIGRVLKQQFYVEFLFNEADLSMTDEMFLERILAPSMAILEQYAQQEMSDGRITESAG